VTGVAGLEIEEEVLDGTAELLEDESTVDDEDTGEEVWEEVVDAGTVLVVTGAVGAVEVA